MLTFIDFLTEVLSQFFGGIKQAAVNLAEGLFATVNVGKYMESFDRFRSGFGAWQYVLAVLLFLVIIAIPVFIILMIIRGIRRRIGIGKTAGKHEALMKEIGRLNGEVIKLTKEKDRLYSVVTGHKSGLPNDFKKADESESVLSAGESRFDKLTDVDREYAEYDGSREGFDDEITLAEICDQFRNFACSRMGLFYDKRIIRLFVAGLSSTRLIILQGISGTGKTSLPYAWGKFLKNDSQIASVQPSWRDRTELFGFFNEFTKRYSETMVLRRMYEATYTDKIYFTILDEMNIARVEYYFAEMLSILEMPSRNEWIVDLTPSGWDNDPKHIIGGRFRIPENMWYIGTANNDDSTFAISDKVYDRAIPINIDAKGVRFDAPYTNPLPISFTHIEELFKEAKEKHRVSDENLEKLEKLDNYVIEHFRIAFGNRIVKQLRDFVPAYVACGGSELDGIDYVLTNKIFRKFEQLNLAFIRDELDGLMDYLTELFGKDSMSESRSFLNRLKKLV